MAMTYDYCTVAEIRAAAMGVETDDYADAALELIGNQFAGLLHQELKIDSQYTNGTKQWNSAKTYVLEKSAAFIVDQYPDNSINAERHEARALLALNALKKKGSVQKTQGFNNYAE